MSALVLDGKALAEKTEQELSARVAALKAGSNGQTPILATILVGDDPASATYVKMKGNACTRIGMESLKVELPSSTTTDELLAKIHELNNNPNVHGILLQHPVPHQIDERLCFDAISAEKDVDGVTCLGFGRMSMGEEAYGCATPKGIMRLLEGFGLNLPASMLLLLAAVQFLVSNGADAVECQRYRHYLPLTHTKLTIINQTSRYFGWRCWQTRIHQSRMD